jgi:tetratricopeptide (TPR) repeat protein
MRSTRNLLLVVTFGAMAIAAPVLAQQPSDYPAPCDATKTTKADIDRAHTVFLSGKQFLEESNYDKAISYFKDAYSIDCGMHAMLPIIATAYERKGDKGEAVRALEEYLKRAPNAPDHDVIERRIKNMRDQLARDQPPAASSVPAPTGPSPAAGPSPTATAEATATASSPTSPTAGAALAPHTEGHTALPWVVVGVGGAAVVTGLVLYAVGASDISSAEKKCPARVCSDSAAFNQGNNGRSLANLGGGVTGAGLAVVAAGLIWHFLERPSDGTGAAPATGTRVFPVAGPGYGGIALRNTF